MNSLVFATNDRRSLPLENVLQNKIENFSKIEYDSISPINRYLSLLITFHRNRKVWWNKYQWHSLVQNGRRRVLLKAIKNKDKKIEGLLMWGSWFNPQLELRKINIPLYVYIDQSCNRNADEGDFKKRGLGKARTKFNKIQFQTYKSCEAIFCMSDWAKGQTLSSHDLPRNNIYVVGWGPIGVNLLNEGISFNDKEPTVLFVGNDYYRKGVDFLRTSIPAVVKRVSNVKFKIVGNDVSNLKIDPHPNLEIIGSITDKEKLKNLYRNATIFVLPHRFDRSPHVLPEAMSAGKPIITSKQGGAVEAIKHGETGFLIDVGDVKSLSDYMVALLTNKTLCLGMGERGKRLMEKHFTWEAVVDKMLDVMVSYHR